MGNLAWCYDNGKGVERDVEESTRWYKRGAQAGDTRSMYSYAYCCEYGDGMDPGEPFPGSVKRL